MRKKKETHEECCGMRRDDDNWIRFEFSEYLNISIYRRSGRPVRSSADDDAPHADGDAADGSAADAISASGRRSATVAPKVERHRC